MFKCKTDFNAFDTHNEKVANLAIPKTKALSKAGVKKLLAKPGERSPFFLILNYFKDDNDKPQGHFLTFGINKKMTKHFETVEMKPGKPTQRMSANVKEAASGEAYVKLENGKKMVCFEPSTACKIPGGKWAKILKSLKAMLGGMKGVVVINGQVVGEETASGEERTDPSNDPTTEGNESSPNESTSEDTLNDPSTGEPAPRAAKPDVAAIKAMVNGITHALKVTLPKEIVPKIKAKTIEPTDQATVQDILEQFETFIEVFEGSSDAVKNKLAKVHSITQQQRPKVAQIATMIEKLLGTRPEEAEAMAEEMDPELEAILAEARAAVQHVEANQGRWQKELESSKAAPLPGGADFLSSLA